MSSDGHQFVRYQDLLTAAQIRSISGPAARLFAMVWNRWAYKDVTTVLIPNEDVISRTKIQPFQLLPAQRELSGLGWVDVELVSNDSTRYSVPPEEQEQV